ncbi:hypothetical protein CB0940_01002 [Cercospora beticola]|uniref:ER membrane protein complex subunit 5 n=1 Tax=Cercospora beticola TaxID=122368 RepID=A0A2G5I7Y7_CERBT|nr:hypothetical protein CB0940_01002 [Cercospora beticola]PIB00911.1 hypothetical protein CB0940_01002 [Cercospora beticola]WPA96426.1 hypothetical protein RHO25_001033 [Cercospora beticola]CAK1355253.1 unnamed protein product [Cercospora beticola]
MGASANLFNLAGLVFLSHAVYSSYEHSLLPSSALPTPSSSIIPSILDPKISIPTDIVLETLFSVLLLCVGVVLGSPDLQPIQWNVWAGRLERSKEARTVTAVGVGGGNPFAALEERPGFLDIRKTRDEFAALKKHGAVGGKS